MLTLNDLNEKLLKLESLILKDLTDQKSLKDALFEELLKFGGSNTELDLYIEGFSTALKDTEDYDEIDDCLIEYYEKLISDYQFDYELTAKIILSINHILYQFYDNTGIVLLFSDISNDIFSTIISRYLLYIGFREEKSGCYVYKNNSSIRVIFDDGEVIVEDESNSRSAYTIDQALNYILSAISDNMRYYEDQSPNTYSEYANTINRILNKRNRLD